LFVASLTTTPETVIVDDPESGSVGVPQERAVRSRPVKKIGRRRWFIRGKMLVS
jgi:hypothetical protein